MTTKVAKAKKTNRKVCTKKCATKKCATKNARCTARCDELTMKNFCILWGCIFALVLIFVFAFSVLIPIAKALDTEPVGSSNVAPAGVVEETEKQIEEAEKVLEQ